jgi:hypothetical protein
MKRIALAAVVLGIVLLAAGAAYLVWSLDARVARAIEQNGTRIAGTPVSVKSVDIELAAGKGTIRGLRVANPEGFSGDDAIALDAIELVIDGRSLGQQPFRVTRVRIGESVVNFELTEQGGSNIERIARHVSGPSDTGESSRGGEPQRIAIEELSFVGGEIFLAHPGAGDPERVNLPSLELQDLGGEQGATGGEIGELIARAFMRRVVAATAGHQVGRAVEKELGGAAGDVAETLLRRVLE